MTAASTTAVSGLNANSTAIATRAKNISNSNTVGYKTEQTYFMSQVTGNGGNPGSFAPGGVTTSNLQNIEEQGLLAPSANATDLALTGNGYMVVSSNVNVESGITTNNVANTTSTGEISYTRAGSFATDKNGYLVNPSGFNLMGWSVDQYGNVASSLNTSDLGSLSPINVSNVNGFAKATTTLQVAANLPSDLTTAPIGASYPIISTIFDSLGEAYTLTCTWTKTAVGTYTASYDCPQATSILKNSSTGSPYSGATAMTILFDDKGQPISFDGASQPPSLYIQWDPTKTNAAPSTITLDLGTAGTLTGIQSRAGDFNVSKNINDGVQFGNYNGVSVDGDGIVSAYFDNGTTLPIYRIAMANFSAPNQLEAKTGNVWIQTNASGKYVLGFANNSGLGRFNPNNLENSTVNLANEITNLIGIEHAYSANTRVIQTDSNMLKTLLDIR